MPDPLDHPLIEHLTDKRTWQAAASLTETMKMARENGCDCDVCVQLRGVAGALGDMGVVTE